MVMAKFHEFFPRVWLRLESCLQISSPSPLYFFVECPPNDLLLTNPTYVSVCKRHCKIIRVRKMGGTYDVLMFDYPSAK